MADRIYWAGNSAKAFVLQEILATAAGADVAILDHGCGRGGSWPEVLDDHPNLALIAWDPDTKSAAVARDALAGRDAQVSVGQFPTGATADFVVSFSVFEHVWDKPRYLAEAHGALRPGGAFYLNYDDGHFRNVLDLDEPRAVRGWLRAVCGQRLHARQRSHRNYQRRVTLVEADGLLNDAGFTVEATWYHNLDVFKRLIKQIPEEQIQDFARFWLDVEERLNHDFSVQLASPARGDASALWQIAASRTLLLRSGST